MKNKITKAARLIFGLFLFALGSVIVINAHIGVAPWDVFNQGLSNVTGITVGRASIYSGIVIVILNIVLGQNIGWGTVVNMILIGMFMDVLMIYDIIPIPKILPVKLFMILLGIISQGMGTYFYISVGLGAGPRDGLMVALVNRTGKSIGIIKGIIETSAVVIGFAMGGNLGIGTLIMSFFSGYVWEFMYKKMNFQINAIRHRFIQDDIKYIKAKFKKAEDETPQ